MYQTGCCPNCDGLLSVDENFRDLDAPLPLWRLGFDGKAVLEAVVGSVVGLIALFSSDDHISLPHRFFLRMLNWRRDPAREMRLKQLEKELALLDWMHSELDLIEADL